MTALTAPSLRPGLQIVDQVFMDRLVAKRIDLLLVLALVVVTLNSKGALGFMASPPLKVATSGAAAVAAVILLVRGTARPPAPVVILLTTVLAVLLAVTSLIRHLPMSRYVLLGQYLALMFCLVVWISVRPDRVLGILFCASFVHLILARVFPTTEPWGDGTTRLGGGSHPIQLGFEATAVSLVALAAALQAAGIRRRLLFFAIFVYAVYILVLAFSRQSLVAEAIAVVVMMAALPGAFRWVRAFSAVVAAVVLVAALGDAGVASLLGANHLQDLSTATGRTVIWARLLTYLPDYGVLGYGIGALSDANGPDSSAYFASFGEPAENAILQILLAGGVGGLVIWVCFILAATIVMLRAKGPSRVVAFAFVPVVLSSIIVNTGLADGGIQYWWLLGMVAESGLVVSSVAVQKRSGAGVLVSAS